MVSNWSGIATGLGVIFLILNGCTVESQRRGRLGAGVNIAKEFDCPEEFGYYQHPSDCSMYYVCVFGGALLESCTGGLMYSQELQTCDWPRNVGCGVTSEGESATISSSRVTEPRSRLTTLGSTRNPGISSREQSQRQQQDEIAKHQLYADDVGPAEEVENDRQQRVYRGQPSTITLGQNLDTRHQVTNAIPSPSGRIASGDKISVISFGTQQQPQQQIHHAQYRAEPTSAPSTYAQELLVQPTKPSAYNNSQQYDLTQYDPYYSLYDEDVELYRDVDYGQFPTNQGQQQNNQQQYRGQNNYKAQEQAVPVRAPVLQQDQRNPAYVQPTINYNQDVYTQTINAQIYNNDNNYNQQTDDGQYQPIVRVPTKPQQSRLETKLRSETSYASTEDSRQVPSQLSPTSTLAPTTNKPKHVVRRILLKTAVSLRDPFKSSDNQSIPQRIQNDRDQNDSRNKPRQGSPIIVTLNSNLGNQQRVNTQSRNAVKTIRVASPESQDEIRNVHSIRGGSVSVDVTEPNIITAAYNQVVQQKNEARTAVKSFRVANPEFQDEIRNVESIRSGSVLVDVTEPNIITAAYNQVTVSPKYFIRRPTTEPTVVDSRERGFNPREVLFRATVENVNDYNLGTVLAPPIVNIAPTEDLPIRSKSSLARRVNENKISRQELEEVRSPPIVEVSPFSVDLSSLNPDNSLLPTETPARTRGRIVKGRISNTPKCSEGDSKSCNEIPRIRVKSTTASPEILTTPGPIGPVRGSVRNRGSASYTTASGEVVNRGTPATITRSRPTLKPSTAIVSKAQEFVDIYRFGEASRPEPVYATPQVDKTAAKCRKDVCLLPDCSCGGKEIPADLPPESVPQIVLLTFDDSVNDLNKGLYSSLFEKGRVNPNGCPIAATFYVSHEWTNYGQVQSLYADGHEIASHSVSHSFGEQFSQKKWTREIAGQREILAAYGGVKLEDIRGMRAPFLSVGGNKMFKMLYDSNFTYDSSMPVYENRPPSYPYTFDYKIFHDCMIPPCPTRSYPGVWEVPMVMWQDLNGGRCSMGDACSNPPTSDGVYKMLIKNFERHYTTNRAPFGLFYHAAWFTQAHHKEGFEAFLDTIVNMPDVWLVTNWQALQWVRDPTPISRINNFQPFQCNYPERPKRCNNPKVCNLWHKSGVRYMKTCQPCPDVYPWTGKSGVRNSRVDNEIIEE